MNDNVPQRLRELDEEIAKHRKNFQNMLDEIGWQADKLVLPNAKMLSCTNNPHHYVPASSLKQHVITCQSKVLQPLLTTEAKLHQYEENVKSSLQTSEIPEIISKSESQTKKEDDHSTFLKELQQQRDLKRRRVAYRKRASYTGRKTNTEKMKDLIESMMETLEDDSTNKEQRKKMT